MCLTFLCCDMGETNALIPVMQELQRQKIDFNVIAMGVAINKLKNDVSLKDRVIEIKEIVDTAKNRTKPLENVVDVIKNLQPMIVISGPASKAQEQLLRALPAKKKIVYLDNFNYAISNSSFETVKGVASVAQKIICVSDIVKGQMLAIEKGTLKEKDIKPLGRPSLENWVSQVHEINKTDILKKIGFNPNKKIVVFIGGYGSRYDDGINHAYDNAMKVLKEAGYQVYIQHHPNILKQQPLTTIEAVGIADFIVCYDSSVGFEALFADKKVIFLQPENVEPYDNIAIQKKLANSVQTNAQLLEILESPSTQTKDVYAILGIEKKSTEAITSYILKKLKKISSIILMMFLASTYLEDRLGRVYEDGITNASIQWLQNAHN
jgi:hypothetical protein